ncbi:hypothetical protein ACJ73_07880 [Blastomyces percursus]|uniref:Grh/CP2 DB domain-containing protein n=1 Tax=Blastomyces percursus TaxID=1658174 RepID=A0A1J9QY69_9EURO|nr:hypothetical protein ACJ73_07880 [Blastomyces percursus]
MAHRKCEHGDQKATSVEVNKLYSWIPEELIWVFVKICPTCQFKSSSQKELTQGVLFVYNLNDIHHRDFPQWLRPIPVQNQMISTLSRRKRNTRMTLIADRMVENYHINGVNASSHISFLPHGIGLSTPVNHRTNPGNENFRFNVTLKAATAMLSILDTAPMTSGAQPLKYRTFIRVSFEDDERRSKPASYWQLWKEGRGSNEAHHRDGKLLAVEHVDNLNPGRYGDIIPSQIHLETSNFDGFSVIWSPTPGNGNPCCSIQFFSISAPPTLAPNTSREFLLAYAPKQRLYLPSMEVHPLKTGPNKSVKLNSGLAITEEKKLEENPQNKLYTFEGMILSIRPFSAFNLKGDAQDDPDLFPVHLGITDEGFSH